MKLVSGKFCMPCKILHQWMEENGIKIDEQLDSQKDQEEVEKFGIKQTPTLVLDDNTLVAGLESIKEYLSKGEN